ncbi:Serine/threonine protein phosphatase PrpC [Jiangella alkaliphila]|uniref:Serine/threonine protein phosphatase PrpC n=2 Tax=Jiangella alkaliphila TaxID=419479 RepID=A0A1H2GG82_9ACTN|nr:Serine/threonine protein phosphatase PrpC [Jiangella alkaliphila]
MPMLRFRPAARSDRGLVRANNEDSGYASAGLLLVADGVGGNAAGEVASASVAHVVASFVLGSRERQDPVALLSDAVGYAFAHLSDGVRRDPARAGMATTLTALLADGDGFTLAHVGDSRGYLLRGPVLRQLTRDDTLVQELIDEGRITRQDVASHPYRSVVVRSVAAESPPVVSIVRVELEPGDRVLLCSDGLTDLVPDDLIVRLLDDGSPTTAAQRLVDAALAAGGRDNVTCIVGDVDDGNPHVRNGHLVGAHQNPVNLIDPAAALAYSLERGATVE